MRRVVCVLLLCVAVFASGCAAWRAIAPGGVSASDAEWDGVVSGPAVPAVSVTAGLATNDQRIAAVLSLLQSAGQQDPLGVFLPVVMVGESSPRWVLCTGKLVPHCTSLLVNTPVHFAGQAIGAGTLWRPSMLKVR